MLRHTKIKVRKIEGAPMVPLCPKYGAILTIISRVLKVSVEPNRLSNLTYSIRAFFLSSYSVTITSARAKVKGHRELNIEQNPPLVKLAKGFKIW